MTLEEYKKAIKTSLKEDYNIEQEYIDKLDSSIEISYKQQQELSKITGTDRIDPGGYCYAASLMYPDILWNVEIK